MSSFAVVLDTSVLFPAALRDTLLRAAGEGLYRPHWSEDILAELRRNLAEDRGLSDSQTEQLVTTMLDVFPEALVEGYQLLIPTMTNDPKDRHVLAAAVVANAQVIVTSNVRHFPQETLDIFSIETQSPDEFLSGLFDLAPDLMVQIVNEQALALHRPPHTVEDVLAHLAAAAPVFASSVRQMLGGAPTTIADSASVAEPASSLGRGKVYHC